MQLGNWILRLDISPTGVSLIHDVTDGTAYTDRAAGLVADGTDCKDGTAM